MSKQTKSENQIIYICDFRRYEKSSSKKRGGGKWFFFLLRGFLKKRSE